MHQFSQVSRGGGSVILGTDPVTVFGNDCKLWINTASPTNKTLFGPYNARMSSLVSDDNNHYLFDTNVGNEPFRNVGNKAFYIADNTFLRQSSQSNWNILHNGSSWSIAFRYRPLSATSTTLNPIVNNNNNTTANIGIYIAYDNRSSASRTHALVVIVTKGVGGQSITISANNFFTTSDLTTCVITYNSATGDLKAYKNGTLNTTVNKGAFTAVTTNATGFLMWYRYSNNPTFSNPAMIKHPIIINRLVTDPERATLEFIVEQGAEDFGSSANANFYWGGGQSNFDGSSGESNSAHLTLRNQMETYMWSTTGRGNVQISQQQGFDYTQWKKNPNPTASTGNDAGIGPWLSFAYQMSLYNPRNTFYSVYAVGGTAIQDGVTSPDWNVASGSTECAQQSTNQIVYSLDLIKYIYDRTPIIRGWQWRLGESDGINPLVSFKADMTALIKKHIDAIEAAGYSTSLMRMFISKVYHPDYADPTRPYTDDVDAVYLDMAANWGTDNPTYASKIKGWHVFDTDDLPVGSDDTHFTSTSMKLLGERFYTYAEPYMNET